MMDMDKFISRTIELNPKMVMICNPNNPTGYLISKQDIERLLKVYSGLVVIDEAYIEFTEGSMLNRLGEYENLVILRTFSKAWGIAGARVGYMIANEPIIENIKKVKAPYNLNALSQQAAVIALQNKSWMLNNVSEVIRNRERLYKIMSESGYKVYKSFANFLYFEADDSLFDALLERGILIRAFGKGKYRVTIGNEFETSLFIDAINMRIAV
jgi:histidinol-phosphate aminotransferase